MAKIDFKKFKMFTDITQERTVEVDARKTVADVLYIQFSGIAAHDLAFRIYRSEGEMEVNDEEASLLMQLGEQSTGVFRDSLHAALDKGEAEAEAEATQPKGN